MSKTSSITQALCVLVTLIAELLCSAQTHAAPVTLRFDATIHSVFQGFPFDSGIDFAVGDTITGQFTFDPSDGDPVEISYFAIQPYDFELDINGTELFLSSYTLTVRNNAPISDFPPADLIDGLEALGLFASAGTSNIDPSRSGLQFYLKAAANTLPTPSFPTDDDVWNQFILEKELSVSFGSVAGGTLGAIGFQATIGSFISVPEPATLIIGLPLSSSFLFRRFRFCSKSPAYVIQI